MNRLRVFPVVLIASAVVFPCSIDTSPRFVPGHVPEKTQAAFIGGELGILTPELRPLYKLIAWRYLAGMPLSKDEREAVARPATVNPDAAVEQWQAARAQKGYLNRTKRSRVAPDDFYTNCLDDAFTTAAATLADRRKTYRSETLAGKWATAQDEVFANCSGDAPVYPAEPDASFPALARADRMYQIGAAHFYAEDFDGALDRFRAIAADRSSPWQATARYMTARVLLRRSSLLRRPDDASLARARLIEVAADAGAGRFQNAARELTDYADLLIDPSAEFRALSRRFAVQHPGPAVAATLDTAVYVLSSSRFAIAYENPTLPAPFDWIRAMDSKDGEGSLRRWKETHSELWLIPALIHAQAEGVDTPALLEAARTVPESSPAFATAAYHSVRLTLEGGHPDTARDMLDRLLSGKPRKLASVDNAFRAQRMGMATSFDDFLRWAPRRPIGYAEEDEDNLDANDAPVLDSDSIDILNRATPLEKLAEAARSPRLPDWIAADVALIGLTRAIVLGNDSVALSLIPIVAKAHPGWAGDLKAFAAANGEQRRFAADLLIERHSEFRTDLSPEFHVSPPNVGIEFYAWWCAEDPGKKPAAVPDAVLSAEEQTRAGDESRRLRDAGPAQAFIAPSVIAWARSHPADARVPEALHDIVRITRYGCRGIPEINGPISQAAFDLLHQNYPASEWAKRTPYWFKD